MLDERFWSKVARGAPDDCWLWTASKNNKGYGLFSARGLGFHNKVLVHRLSYMAAFGSIPEGMSIMHTCDTPACVNPAHLRVGTHAENMRDMLDKGRHGHGTTGAKSPHRGGPKNPARFIGSSNPYALLTDKKVIALRRDYIAGMGRSALAAKYGVSPLSVDDYTSGKSWPHLLGRDGAPSLSDLEAARNRTPGAKITMEIAREIRALLASGETGRAVAARFGIHFATVSDIKLGRIWPEPP